MANLPFWSHLEIYPDASQNRSAIVVPAISNGDDGNIVVARIATGSSAVSRSPFAGRGQE